MDVTQYLVWKQANAVTGVTNPNGSITLTVNQYDPITTQLIGPESTTVATSEIQYLINTYQAKINSLNALLTDITTFPNQSPTPPNNLSGL